MNLITHNFHYLRIQRFICRHAKTKSPFFVVVVEDGIHFENIYQVLNREEIIGVLYPS